MKCVILDAAPYRDAGAAVARRVLAELCAGRGWTPHTIFLPDLAMADCVADFKCWTRTPGVCAINDANRAVAQAFVESDVAVFLTPVTFGGYASELKKALDHLIPDILPFFEKVDGETHHERRYERLPNFLALGILPSPDPDAQRVFHALAARNALNIRGRRHASAVVHADAPIEAAAAVISRAIDHVADGEGAPGGLAVGLEPADAAVVAAEFLQPDAAGNAPRRALLIVGSPGAASSTSAVLGGTLVGGLEARGLVCETSLLYRAQRSTDEMAALDASIDRADLVVLAAPLYVDSLPAPVIRLLERTAARRVAGGRADRRLVAIVNCGFPEVQHNITALAIIRCFARAAGFGWAGALPLGGGGMIGGRPLASLGGRVRHLVRGLDVAATALAAGEGIPAEAVALFSRKAVPFWLYRFFGDRGFTRSARRHGVAGRMRDRPYERGAGTEDQGSTQSS